MTQKIQLQSFNTGMQYNVELVQDYQISVSYKEQIINFTLKTEDEKLTILDLDYISDDVTYICLESIFTFFTNNELVVKFSNELIINNKEFNEFIQSDSIVLKREEFSSIGNIWAKRIDPNAHEEIISTQDVKHPKRAPYVAGELLYKKYYSTIGKTLSFRVIDLDKDLDRFHTWHNKKSISEFWELNKSKDELRHYLEIGLNDPHSIPTILEFNNEPIGYFEFYWAKEDRLGPFFNFSDYDRGFHFLIGETSCLGRENIDTILKATAHYSFLHDKRANLLAGEPRSDNKKIIRYINHFECWRKEKEFNFPHKRAALLLCDRETYFKEGYPWT